MAQARRYGKNRPALVALSLDRLLVSVEELGYKDDVRGVAGLGTRRLKSPAAILKSGTQEKDFSAAGGLFPLYSLKIFFCTAKFETKIAKKAKIKLLMCHELRISKVKARVVKSLCS
jgi:hypothetical protein